MSDPLGPNVTVVRHALVQHKLTLMRSADTPVPQFRQLLRETATLLAFEALRELPLTAITVRTPLGDADGVRLRSDPALISILRAGNGLLDGFLDVVPSGSVGFIGMYRDHDTLEAVEYYANIPRDLAGRTTVVVDPMLATANTAIAALRRLREAGATNIVFVCLVAAPEGIERFHAAHADVPIITAAIDDRLDERGYIVPGLGDAGDRIFGTG